MPHTISGKTRVNRPDSRPNAKRRKKERTAAMEAAKVEDLRATSIPKSKRKERRVTGELKKELLPPDAKRARFLQKLLRQIEALKDRKEAGDKLDKAQLQKLGRMDEVVAELEELFGVDLGSSDEEEEEEDGEGKYYDEGQMKEKNEDNSDEDEEELAQEPIQASGARKRKRGKKNEKQKR